MMDILIKNDLPEDQLKDFLALTLSITAAHIMTASMDDFSEMGPIDFTGVKCLCVYTKVSGDAAKQLQLYRYDVPDDEMPDRLQRACQIKGVTCYIPKDSFDNWYLIDGSPSIQSAKQIESEEGIFLFNQT